MVNSSRADIEAFKVMWNDIPRVTKEVYVPDMNETIDISVDTRQFEIRISDEIATSIQWQTVQPLPQNISNLRFKTNKSPI